MSINLEKHVLTNEIMRYRALLGWTADGETRRTYSQHSIEYIRQWHQNWINFARDKGVLDESGEGSTDQ